MTSRKLIICLLASMVMRNPLLLKMRHISFLMFSVSLGVALVALINQKSTSHRRIKRFRERHAKDDPIRKIQASKQLLPR